MNSVDIRRPKLAAALKWGIGLVAVFVAGLAAITIVQGILALSLLGIAAAAVVYGSPWAAMKLANMSLSAQKHEARENPIETRQTMALRMRADHKAGGELLTTFSAEVMNFADQVKALKHEQPDDSADFDTQLESMRQLLEHRRQKWNEAGAAIEAFEKATERAARKWKVAQSAAALQKLSGAAENKAMDKLLAAESLDAVQTAMNRALAEMNHALAVEAPPQLAAQPSHTIDVNAVEIREKVRL